MSLTFTKMHGLGNDFIVIDATKKEVMLTPELIQRMADRRTGIGFDQLLIIAPALTQEADFIYRIYNADGQEVGQCGNGARCVAYYIFSEGLIRKKEVVLATSSGKLIAQQKEKGQITVNMGVPQFAPESIPFQTERKAPPYELQLAGQLMKFGVVSLGNPHVVFKVNDIGEAPVQQIGQLLQHHPAFPQQVNVGFMEAVSPDFIRLRVYERGVGETRACGSGACAAMAIGRRCHDLSSQVVVELPGGRLRIDWSSQAEPVFMTGPAEKIFKGELFIC
jgi:diaminopimelate epimerase